MTLQNSNQIRHSRRAFLNIFHCNEITLFLEQNLSSSFIRHLLTFNFSKVRRSVISQTLSFSSVKKISQMLQNLYPYKKKQQLYFHEVFWLLLNFFVCTRVSFINEWKCIDLTKSLFGQYLNHLKTWIFKTRGALSFKTSFLFIVSQ